MENVTLSELSFVPTTEDDGKSITCRAENPNVTGLFLETSWKIDVVCKYKTLYYSVRYELISVVSVFDKVNHCVCLLNAAIEFE